MLSLPKASHLSVSNIKSYALSMTAAEFCKQCSSMETECNGPKLLRKLRNITFI